MLQFDVCCKAIDQKFDCGCDRCAILRLDSLIEEQHQSGFDQCNLRDLHRCISQLLIQWNCKVLRLEATVGHIQEGRQRKSVNIELVFNKIKIIIQWNPSITDTFGDQHFVHYSEVSPTQGLPVYFP